MEEGYRVVGVTFVLAAAMIGCLHIAFRNKGPIEVVVKRQDTVILQKPMVLAESAGQSTVDFGSLKAKPNILIFIADDMGYEDLACYGHAQRKANYIDKLAAKGIRFQSVYSADSLCSPARAGLLTGRLPVRNGVVGHPSMRLFTPVDTGGLPHSETTIPELLKTVGYRTGMIGKWHMGINAHNSTDGYYLPRNQGFDFVGINLPLTHSAQCDESKYWMKDGPSRFQCFLYNDSQIIQQPVNYTGMTDRLTNDFNQFLDTQPKDKPFFFYYSFPQMHDALFSWMSKFAAESGTGLYGGDILEMADAVEKAMANLRNRGMEEDTMVIFLSDHGPHVELCNRGGQTPFKGGKGTSFEGGFRIPFIISWPSVIRGGAISRSVLSTLDLLPTFAALTDAELPKAVLDGTDQRAAFFDSSVQTTHRPVLYYCNDILMAMRYGAHKFHFRTVPPPTPDSNALQCPNGLPLQDYYANNVVACTMNSTMPHDPPLVYNVQVDPKEYFPVDYTLLPSALKAKVNSLINHHQLSLTLDKQPPQLGNQSPFVAPCCNPPKCQCDYNGDSVRFVVWNGQLQQDGSTPVPHGK